jgi:hypothetical protein
MDQKQATPEKEINTRLPVLFVAFELGNSTWKMRVAMAGRSGRSPLRRGI